MKPSIDNVLVCGCKNSQVAAELRRLEQSEREGWRYADELEQERKRLTALNAELVEALEEAVYEIADWGGYASEYFQNKHDLKGVINKFQTLVAKAKEQT